MEVVTPFFLPIKADSVLSPQIHYGLAHYGEPITGIYFVTADDQYGRITFESLDALKFCRGEVLPYPYDWSKHERGIWVFKIENSRWLKERFDYENKHYGSAYEFGGNVQEMLTDFSHYLFSFHDEFVEVIARGLWFEQAAENLFGKPLQLGHPSLPLPDTDAQRLEAHGLTCQVRRNPLPTEQLIASARYCSQTLLEFALELDGEASVTNTLTLAHSNGQLTSSFRGFFGRQEAGFEGVATLADVQPYLEKYMAEVAERRQEMGN
ncbi:MAG: hypothetical protein ACRYFX_12270 [Janthinobacterium lividum]